MTESSAAAAATSTVQVSITLPQLEPDSVPPPDKAATARVQQILNDFAKADNKERIFHESGVFGPKTKEHLIRFQQKHNISPATGIAGPKTWKALLGTLGSAAPPSPGFESPSTQVDRRGGPTRAWRWQDSCSGLFSGLGSTCRAWRCCCVRAGRTHVEGPLKPVSPGALAPQVVPCGRPEELASGVMALIGQARAKLGASFPLIGVTAGGTVKPDGSTVWRAAVASLEPNHTHVVLVPGARWGDESSWLADVASWVAGDARQGPWWSTVARSP